MSEKKKVILEFVFEEKPDKYDEEYSEITLVKIKRTHSDLDEGELSALGESIAQTDTWQVDRWNDIQNVLGGLVKAVQYPK